MNLLSSSDITEITNCLNLLVSDTDINTSIKYRQYIGQDYYNPREQTHSNSMYTDWSGVSVMKGTVGLEEANRVGNIQVGDVKYTFMRSSISNTLSTSDLVIDSGVTYDIVTLGYDTLGIAYVLYTRRSS